MFHCHNWPLITRGYILLLWYRITCATWHGNDSHVFLEDSSVDVQISDYHVNVLDGSGNHWKVTSNAIGAIMMSLSWKKYENNENIEMDLSESRLHQTLILKNDGLSSFHDISPSNVLSIWRVTSPCHHIHIPCGTIISYPTISHYMMWI